MKILFLHGWKSTPGGVKPTCLAEHGHEVLNPTLPDDDFDAAAMVAQADYDRGQPDVVVGSSRGGAVAMNINIGDTPLVLLCPAWKTWGTATTVKPSTVVLHSRNDETVPFSDSEELVINSGLSSESLIEVGTEHRLADEESLGAMVRAVEKSATPATKRKDAAKKSRSVPWGLLFVLGIVLIDMVGMLMALLLPALQTLWSGPGIHVMLRNDGAVPLHSVVLHATGASYELGDIEPREVADSVIRPSGESHLVIEFADTHGKISRLNAGGYFEPGYRGTIQVSIKDSVIDENEQHVGP